MSIKYQFAGNLHAHHVTVIYWHSGYFYIASIPGIHTKKSNAVLANPPLSPFLRSVTPLKSEQWYPLFFIRTSNFYPRLNVLIFSSLRLKLYYTLFSYFHIFFKCIPNQNGNSMTRRQWKIALLWLKESVTIIIKCTLFINKNRTFLPNLTILKFLGVWASNDS